MRVLIATVTAGAGHLQAAAALEEAWCGSRPDDEVRRLDVLDFTPRLFRKAYADGYMKVVAHAPELWSLMFSKTDNPDLLRKATRIRRTLARIPAHRFVQEVRRFNPDVALCTHFLPLEILGRMSDRRGAPACFVVSVITDFEAHALWMEPVVDLYCVAAEETKARLVARGVEAAKVMVTGIPVAAKFALPVNARAARKHLGLRDDLPVVLVLSGGFGVGPVSGILGAMKQIEAAMQVVAVCGRNQDLRRKLAALNHRHPTQTLGFVTNMQELMAAADLVITKPGGLTSSEALAIGRPIVIVNPIPGQEAANSDFLLERGVATKASRVEDIPFRLGNLLGSNRLKTMRRAAKRLGRPDAAQAVCRAVLERLAQKETNSIPTS